MQPALTLTRRSLLRAGALGAAATFVGLRPWAAAPAAAAPGHLLRSSYDGLVGQGFRVGSADLRLLSVDDLAGAAVDKSLAGSEDAFVLAFAGPLDAALEGGTHSVTHPALGSFELFVSEVEQPQSERRYEAVIDRSVRGPRSARKRAAAAARPTGRAAGRMRMVRRIALRRTASGARADVLLPAPPARSACTAGSPPRQDDRGGGAATCADGARCCGSAARASCAPAPTR